MYIAVFKNNGKDYLRLMESYRTKSANGKVSIRKRIIHNIGPLSKFDDGEPNFLERLRESFRLGNPIIPELEEYTGKKPPIEKYTIRLQEGDPECVGHPRLYSHVFLDKLLDELGLKYFFSSYKGFSKIEYDVLNFARLDKEKLEQKKYRKEHGGDITEYHETRKKVLELYPSGEIPRVETLEKQITALQETLSQKDAEYRQADKKSRELADAQRTIEEYLRQEQSREQQKKRKRNDLE